MVGENPDTSYDFSVLHTTPDMSFHFAPRDGGEMYQSGGKEEESVASKEQEQTGGIDVGASYDFGFV